ncbi:MAG TPA: R3H domain-containing nucleic acid-binding protein [Candidatus Caenarcaniphilales bacterium]
MSSQHLERGRQWLAELLHLAGFSTVVKVEQPAPTHDFLVETDSCWLTIDADHLTSEQAQNLLGAQGVTLDAVQYLANATLNLRQAQEQQGTYTIELAGYRAQRQLELQARVEQAAAQVRQTKAEFEIPNLSAAERRLVHTVLKASPDLETFSRGQEPERLLVIRLIQDGLGEPRNSLS